MKVLLADDHTIVRQGVRALLEDAGFDVVAEVADGVEAVKAADEQRPDVAILDLMMPTLDGVSAARGILRVSPRTRMVLLTTSARGDALLEAFEAGVTGVVLKSNGADELVEAIRRVGDGEAYLSSGVSDVVVHARRSGSESVGTLSPRERQVLRLIGEGHGTRGIAGLLHLSVKTVESHRAHIKRKLHTRGTADLVRQAIRSGLVQVEP